MLDLKQVQQQIVELCDPHILLLFGSQAKGTARENSDVDLCVVAATSDKRRLLTELYYQVDFERPVDFLLYTPEEWAGSIADPHSFAHKLDREGVLLYG